MHGEELQWMLVVCVLLAGGIIAVLGARLARITPIVGYLVVGAVIGPHSLGWVEDGHALRFLAEFGVAFLMFDIGLHFSLRSLWKTRRQLFGLGPIQLLLTGIPLAFLLSWLGMSTTGAILLGLGLALSSTAVVLQTFAERGERDTPLGRTVTAVLIFQDLAAVLLLVSIGAVASSDSAPITDLIMAFVKIAIAFAAVALLGRAVRPIFDRVVRHEDEATFVALALLLVFATAGLTAAIGLSLALGAFLAGMALSESEYCYRVKTELRPFRGLLLGLFFLTVGMALDTAPLFEQPLVLLAIGVAFIALKVLSGVIAARLLGQRSGFAVRLGFSLGQGSEFAFVIVSLLLAAGLMTDQMASAAIAIIVASMVLTGALIPMGQRLGHRLETRSDATEDATDVATAASGRVIINGLDDGGRAVAKALHALGVDYLALETDAARLQRGRSDGFRIAHGDPWDYALLQSLGLASARALVMGAAGGRTVTELIARVRADYPTLPVLVRALDGQTAGDAAAAGATVCVRSDTPELAELVAQTLKTLGVGDEAIRRRLNEFEPSDWERADKAHQLAI